MVLASEISVHDPRFELDVIASTGVGEKLDAGIVELIESVAYESADGMADMATVVLKNPTSRKHPEGVLTDLKIFQPGNEMNVKFGYGKKVAHVGRVQLIAQSPNFPQDGMPKLTIKGYTKDHLMMEDASEKGSKRSYPKPAEIGDILSQVAQRYGFDVDADGYEFGKYMVQKAGVTDYDFVVGLANLAGAAFWVDGSEDGTWTMHWRLPDSKSTFPDAQEITNTYTRADGDFSNLLSFQPEFAIRETRTKLKCIVRNPQNGRTFIEEFLEDALSPDIAGDGDQQSVIESEQVPGGAAKLFFGEFSFDIVPNKKFKTAAEVKAWASQWFRRNRDNFITGNGKIMGDPSVLARQAHMLAGVGRAYSGLYYFARVAHKVGDGGYTVDFSARKVLP